MKKNWLKISTFATALLLACTALSGCELFDWNSSMFGGNGGNNGDGGNGDGGTVELTFLAVNDLHGKFLDTDDQPGVDELTTYVKDLYADPARHEILLASGDMWQGTVESSSNKGQLMTDWMNDLGFVSMTLGNHEYDWGAAVLTPNSTRADFPFLAINVTQDGKGVDYCQASTTVEKGGVKVGIIGAIGDCLSSISGEFTDGLRFATDNMLTNLVKIEAARLRNEEDCDFIVYSIHDGGSGFTSSQVNSVTNSDMSWYDSSLSNGYVDLVFEAHTHQQYILKDEYNVYHLQGGGENKAISCAEVTIDTATGDYSVTPRLIGRSEYASSSITGDTVVNDIFGEYFPDGNPYDAIGNVGSYKNSTAICNKVAELYYTKGVEVWSSRSDVISGGGIVLGGGFLKARSPYNLYAGKVSYADLFSILPFDNEIVLGQISGYYLKTKFINSTNSDYHIYPSNISASNIDDSKQYYIVVDSYTSTYKSNRITEVVRLGSGIYARDLLKDFIIQNKGWA